MNKTKMIKTQAKKALEGNWVQIIVGIAAVVLVFIALEYTEAIAAYAMGLVDSEGEVYENSQSLLLVVEAGVSILAILISPLINGVLKMAADLSLGNRSELSDMFVYFTNFKMYLKTILLNLLLFIIYSLITTVLNVYTYVSLVFGTTLDESNLEAGVMAILIAALIVSVFLKLLIYMLFIHYPLMAYALNSSRNVTDYVFGLIPFSFANFGNMIQLIAGFIGWFLLCFFVMPAMYVLPYFLVSAVTSAKWLFSIDKSRGIV